MISLNEPYAVSQLVESKLQIRIPACLQIHVMTSSCKGSHRINLDFCWPVSDNPAPRRHLLSFYLGKVSNILI